MSVSGSAFERCRLTDRTVVVTSFLEFGRRSQNQRLNLTLTGKHTANPVQGFNIGNSLLQIFDMKAFRQRSDVEARITKHVRG